MNEAEFVKIQKRQLELDDRFSKSEERQIKINKLFHGWIEQLTKEIKEIRRNLEMKIRKPTASEKKEIILNVFLASEELMNNLQNISLENLNMKKTEAIEILNSIQDDCKELLGIEANE